MAAFFLIVLAAMTPSVVSRGIDPAHAQNITVFHVNPHQFGAAPINMDTGDAGGDMFFDLFQVISQPLLCANKTHHHGHHGHTCTNQEAIAPNLMVNKVTLEVDSRYSGYAKCNVCVNGTDGRGHKCTATETYFCYCEDDNENRIPCNKTVGLENIHDFFGGWGGCDHNSSQTDCYVDAVSSKFTAKTPGYWYSSLATGYCDGKDADQDCSWRVVSVDKIVTRKCHIQVFGEVVKETSPECFKGCGNQSTNSSSPCWTECFYKAALGPDSGRPGGKIAGMSLDALVEAWTKPFLPESEGGCPSQKVLPEMVVV